MELTTGLPWTHFEPRFDDRPFRAVDHDGQARDLGLGGDEVQEARHRAIGVEHPLVHVHVEEVGAAAHLFERDVGGLREVVRGDQAPKPRRAGHVRPLADHLEVAVRSDRERFEAGVAGEGVRPVGHGPWRQAFDGCGNGADVGGRRSAAAADDVHEARLGELPDERRRLVRLLVVLAERVRKAGVGIAADEGVRLARELGDVRPHLAGTEGAVHADREGAGVGDRRPERVDRLARERAAALVGDRHRQHQRQVGPGLLEDVAGRENGGLGVQRVEDRLDQQ